MGSNIIDPKYNHFQNLMSNEKKQISQQIGRSFQTNQSGDIEEYIIEDLRHK